MKKKIGNIKEMLNVVQKEQEKTSKTSRKQTAKRGRPICRGRSGQRSASEGSVVTDALKSSNKPKRRASTGSRGRRRGGATKSPSNKVQVSTITTTIDPVRKGFVRKEFSAGSKTDGAVDDTDLEIVSEYEPTGSTTGENVYDGDTEIDSEAEKREKANSTSRRDAKTTGQLAIVQKTDMTG